MWKKLAWRFGRGAIYTFLSGLAATKGPNIGLDPAISGSLIGGLLLAIDKKLGVGSFVAPAAK